MKGAFIAMADPDPACNSIVYLLVSLAFLILNILLACGDEALKALGDNRIRELEDAGNKRIRRMRRHLENERRFTNQVHLGTRLNALFAIAAVLFGYYDSLRAILATKLNANSVVSEWIGIAVLILIVTICFTLIGSRLPRRLALKAPETTIKLTLGVFSLLFYALTPLDVICRILLYPILRICGIDPNENPDKVTEEDLIELMDDAEEIGAIEEAQADMVSNVLEFDDITAAEIMTPRIDVAAVEINTPIADALRIGIDEGYSRIPVYEEDIDHVVGLLYVKDLLPYVGQPIPEHVTVRLLLRDTHFVPDSKKCDDLFEEMTEKRLQMAIVVDEYGGVAGIVTIEDLLESIVGNIQDEFDDEEDEVTQLDDHSFEVDGSLSIGELEELVDMEISDRDFDTVAGFVMDQLGYIPSEDEQAVVHYNNIDFTVQKMDDRRIEQVLVRINPPTQEEESETEH